MVNRTNLHTLLTLIGFGVIFYPSLSLIIEDTSILDEELWPFVTSTVILSIPYVIYYKNTKSKHPTAVSISIGLSLLALSLFGQVAAMSDAQDGLAYLYLLPIHLFLAIVSVKDKTSN